MFFFNDTATTEIYTLSLHDALPISHKEDVDGICSAALIKAAFDVSKVILADYANLISRLEKVAAMFDKIERLFICDLGLSKKNEQKFIELLQRIASTGAEVVYIDHH